MRRLPDSRIDPTSGSHVIPSLLGKLQLIYYRTDRARSWPRQLTANPCQVLALSRAFASFLKGLRYVSSSIGAHHTLYDIYHAKRPVKMEGKLDSEQRIAYRSADSMCSGMVEFSI